jgi:glycosyltransferase involved in cell wall biosynthesis
MNQATRTKTNLGLSLVLPGYNEEGSIEETVQKCLTTLSLFSDKYEVIIIDDGSTDKTGEIAERLQAENGAVRVIHNPINLGVGISLLIGFHAAKYELVLHNAMDYPFDLNDLEKILPLFPDSDVVVVARIDRSAHSLYRKLTSIVHYGLIRLLFWVRLSDFNFVQVYKKQVLDAVRVEAQSPSFVTLELLIKAKDAGFKVSEMKITFYPRKRGQAHYGKPRHIFWALADMLSFWLKRTFGLG